MAKKPKKVLSKLVVTDTEKNCFNLVNNFIVILDTTGKIIFLNEYAYKFLGYKKDSLLNKNWFNTCIPPNQRKEVKDVFSKIMKKQLKLVEHYENPVVCKNKFLAHISWHNKLLEHNKNILGVISSGTSLIDRKKAEEELNKNQEIFKNMTEVVEVVFWLMTPDWKNMLFVSPAFEKIYGYSCDALLKNPKIWINVIHPDERERVSKAFIEDVGKGITLEYKIVTKSKKIKWIRDKSYYVKDKNGKVKFITGYAEDITKHKEIEQSKKIAEDKYRQTFDDAPYPIVISEISGKILDVNKAVLAYGFKKNMIGTNIRKYVLKKYLAEVIKDRLYLAKTGKERENSGTIEVKTPKGVIWVEFKDNLITLNNKLVVQSTMRDITKQKESKKIYETLYNSSKDAIMTLSPERGFISGNPATVQLFKCKNEDEFVKQSPPSLSPEFQPNGQPSAKKSMEMMKIALKKGSNYFEWTHRTIDGKDFPATVLLTKLMYKGKPALQATVRNISDRKKAELALKQEKEFTDNILGNLNQGVDIVDENLNIVYMNKYFKDIFTEKAIGKKCYQIYKDNKKQCKNCPLKQPINIGETKEIISHGVAGKKSFHITHTGMTLPNGKKAILEIFRDITKEEKAAKKIKDSEEKYHSLFDNMLNGFALHKIITDKSKKPIDYIFLETNDSFEKLTGLKKDNILGRNVTEVIPNIKEDNFDWIKEYGEIALKGIGKKFIARSEALNKWFSVTAYSPEKGYFATIFDDITEQKIAQREVKDNEERFKDAIESMPQPVIIHSNGEILEISSGLTEITGYTKKDIPTMKEWYRLSHKEFTEKTEEYLSKIYKIKETVHDGEWEIITKDNDIRVWDFYTSPLSREYKGKKMVISVAKDITEIKRSGKELQQRLDELERFHKLTIGRELQMIKLKKKIKDMEGLLK